MNKFTLTYDWPVEPGHYLTANPFSPAAVVVVLSAAYENMPPQTEAFVRAGVEKGAGIAGTLQTANIGIEKVVVNIVSNPNIRYLILTGRESGHFPADALRALFEHGTDKKGFILKTRAPTAILKNIPREALDRLREQVRLIDLTDAPDADMLAQTLRACYQEEGYVFKVKENIYQLGDPGAFSKEPIICRLTDALKRKQDG